MEKIKSTKLYIILLGVAVALLIFIGAISYKQIRQLGESAELVTHTMEVNKEINQFFSYHSMMESEALEGFLKEDTTSLASFERYKKDSYNSLVRLKILSVDNVSQQKRIDSAQVLQDSLINHLRTLFSFHKDTANTKHLIRENMEKVSSTMFKLKSLKNDMRREEDHLLKARQEKYESHIFFTPIATILLGAFALVIFVVSFWHINSQREKREQAEIFLEHIMQNTENIINYYEPIYEGDKLVDFNIVYANQRNKAHFGFDPKTMMGERLTQKFPFLLLNGEFDKLVHSYEHHEVLDFNRQVLFQGKKRWFQSNIRPILNGLLVVARESTKDKESEERMLRLNEQLKLQNSILSDAESMAQNGSFCWNKQDNIGTMSANFYRILGCTPNEFEPSPDGFLKFVHPNDLDNYLVKSKGTLKKRIEKGFVFRIITKKGRVKYLRMSAHYAEDTIIHVIQDVTDTIKAEKKLKENNIDLKRSNAELESFNHVASHDLQEPLRKIQMFISRLSDTDVDRLSDRGKQYFEKINASADRMQTLIKNLLSYSRINKSKGKQEKVSLNDILDKVKEELNEIILETGIHLNVEDLPKVNGVPFQLEQLFTNLVANAIKYRNPEVTSRVTIESVLLPRTKVIPDFRKKATHYYKISVIDNGIGFNNENAEKIFEMFQRLHQKNEYSGTGIGLAICKKIVQNHNGYIEAEGVEGNGSSFHIYLPA